MRILGYEINDADDVDSLRRERQRYKQMARKAAKTTISNPAQNIQGTTRGDGAEFYKFPGRLEALDRFRLGSDLLRNITQTVKFEIFRPGFERDVRDGYEEIDESEAQRLDEFMRKANSNDQSMIDVLRSFEDQLNTYDDGVIFLNKDYMWDGAEIQISRLSEIITLNPAYLGLIIDDRGRLGYNEDGEKVYTPLNDRTKRLDGEEARREYEEEHEEPTVRACYAYKNQSMRSADTFYYSDDEVIHKTKYTESLTRGTSPIISVYQKAQSLVLMDDYIKEYYEQGKNPNGILAFKTQNEESLEETWEKFTAKHQQDPHAIHPLAVETEAAGDAISYVDMMNTLEDMQYTATRNEFRKQVGALFYVSPIFMNDQSTSGGLNNEGLQINVTNRGIEMGQRVYNATGGVLDQILEALQINSIELRIKPSEEQDQAYEQELLSKKLNNAEQAARLGLEVQYTEEDSIQIMPGEVEAPSENPISPGQTGSDDPRLPGSDDQEPPGDDGSESPNLEPPESPEGPELPEEDSKSEQGGSETAQSKGQTPGVASDNAGSEHPNKGGEATSEHLISGGEATSEHLQNGGSRTSEDRKTRGGRGSEHPNSGGKTESEDQIGKPFSGFESFTECQREMESQGHDEESAKKICGALQSEEKTKARVAMDLYTTQEEALERAQELGLNGTHTHTVSDATFFMPGETHDEWRLVTTRETKAVSVDDDYITVTRDIDEADRKPNQGMKEAARQALEWRDEHGRDEVEGGTRTGWERANQIDNDESLSRETWMRMHSFFERHGDDVLEISEEYEGEPWKDNGYVAGLLWGGEPGKEKAQRMAERIQDERDKIHSFKAVKTNADGVRKGLQDQLQSTIEDFLDRYDERRPTKQELQSLADKAQRELEESVENIVERNLDKVYAEFKEDIASGLEGAELNNDADELNIKDILGNPKMNQAFSDLGRDVSDRIKEVVRDLYDDGGEGVDIEDVKSEIKSIVDVANTRAENIARTETAKVEAKARRQAYEESEEATGREYKYEHVGPNDRRTTETSKRIKDRTKGGVPWEEYVDIVREESNKDFPEFKVDEDAPASHYQTRHTFVRVQG